MSDQGLNFRIRDLEKELADLKFRSFENLCKANDRQRILDKLEPLVKRAVEALRETSPNPDARDNNLTAAYDLERAMKQWPEELRNKAYND